MDHPTIQAHITGIVNLALSLSAANCMRDFRESVRIVLAGRLHYKQGRPRASDTKRNWDILRMCISGHSRTQHLRSVFIAQVLNGNWENDRLEHICWGCCASEEQCLNKVVSIVVASVAPASPRKFPRQKWTEAINFHLLFLLLHNTLPIVYKVWCSTKPGGTPWETADLSSSGAAVPGVLGLEPLEDIVDDDVGVGAGSSGAGVVDGSDVRGDAAPGLDAATAEPTASDHNRERRLTHAWLTNDPTEYCSE